MRKLGKHLTEDTNIKVIPSKTTNILKFAKTQLKVDFFSF